MSALENLKIALCQMRVVPGRPDLNAAFAISEIEKAAARGVDIIAFPEMCTTGYLIGDIFEDAAFVQDVARWNREIAEATKSGITAIFGTVVMVPGRRGEDGRHRMQNVGMVVKDGKILGWSAKTLQPNYRFFNDDKHMFSLRKVVEEEAAQGAAGTLEEKLVPWTVPTRTGERKIGVILCEDMWHLDYALNPTRILVQNGADIVFNLSASPWTWQKNRKRHQVVRGLLTECRVPFCYVNNTGAQNVGKNILVFDGSSAVYGADGALLFEAPPYAEGPYDFDFPSQTPALPERPPDDTAELYAAMACATQSIVPPNAPVIVGMSGGVDSSVVAAHFVDVLGPDRVIGITMPFLNSPKTQEFARAVAANLGIRFHVRPIKDIVEAICAQTGVAEHSLAYQNVQARARQEVLAAMAQQLGGVFSCNSNKVEMAFGYGTLYGDIAGFYAPLADLVKREVRQIARYLNAQRFRREVLPEGCIRQVPTAELAEGQVDPYDYGGLKRRGYHDEMVRAFTEFRKGPDWFLELYARGKLEAELRLAPGTLKRLFPSPEAFVEDLEGCWRAFFRSYFKRIQCPPIPVFSKRAFGRDLEESLLSAHFTTHYLDVKDHLLAQTESRKRRIAVFGGSFNPPGLHHEEIVRRLAESFDVVLIVPCGIRSDKPSTESVPPKIRKTLVTMAFQGLPRVEFDFSDLDENAFTPTYALHDRYRERFPDAELHYVVGSDLVRGGGRGRAEIQRSWVNGKEVWEDLRFAVIGHPKSKALRQDLPPRSTYYYLDNPLFMMGRSRLIRERIESGEPIDGLVSAEVARLIARKKLYRKK